MPVTLISHRLASLVPRRSSFALVVAVLALAAATASNAVAAIIISSNSQVAAHTIAGANAPSGDNQNLISGSVGATDLHTGAVSPAKLSSDARAHKIDFVATGTTETDYTLLKLDELTLSVHCVPSSVDMGGGHIFHYADLQLIVTSSVNGDVNYGFIHESDESSNFGGGTTPIAGGTPLGAGGPFDLPLLRSLYGYQSGTGAVHRFEGQFIYHNPARVITVAFNAVTWQANNYFCQVSGTAIQSAMQ